MKIVPKQQIKRYDVNQNSLIGTSLIGYINLSYDELKKIFGKPTNGDRYKIDWDWVLRLNDSVLHIYNYKDGPSYTGKKSIKGKDITDWHVSGKYAYDLKILEDYIKQEYPEFNGRPLTTLG